jgi:DnaJ-class molecular chaperone
MAGKDYYQILGISREADDAEIKQAYRKLARKHHPDVNPGDKSAEARFKEINEAYEVLSDPEKRKKYNEFGDQWQYADQIARARQQQGQQESQWQYSEGRESPFGYRAPEETGENIFDEIFREFGSRGTRAANRSRAGQDIEYPVEVTLEEAYTGTSRLLTLKGEDICPGCGGTGRIHNLPCSQCRGAGKIPREKRLEVKIPAGVNDGSRIRFAGQGNYGYQGGPDGDLYLVVTVKTDPRFIRKDADIYETIDIPLADAVLGGEVQVPTVMGKVMMTIPPETQNGKVFNLKGKGMPRMSDTGLGNLFVKTNVIIPQNLTAEERKLFEQLRNLRRN